VGRARSDRALTPEPSRRTSRLSEEFVGATRSVEEIRNELRAADELIEALRSEIGGQRLRVMLALPTLPADERRSGLTWLVGNYGHAREHVGHMQLTKQLYQAHSDGL
jgi:hypothetical protein